MQWWGEPWPHANWRALICEDDRLRIDVPTGEPCMFCEETIEAADQGVTFAGYVDIDGFKANRLHAHRECQLRNVVGCSGNLLHEGHSHDLPYREDARRVEAILNERGTVG